MFRLLAPEYAQFLTPELLQGATISLAGLLILLALAVAALDEARRR
jgi:hypothetical protein